jgi:hypothetical protein
MTDSTVKRRLIPLTEWGLHHSYPPQGQLRALVFNEKNNGFDSCVRRVGKRVLIDEAEFFIWVDNQKYNQENHS